MLPQLDVVQLPQDAVEVGRIAEPWGVKGWFKVHAHSADPQALFSSKRWFLSTAPATGSAATTAALLCVTGAREHGSVVVAGALGVDDRDSALALRGARIYIPRSGFPSTAADEYYWVDLIGLEVVNRQAVALGRVTELLTTAAQTVLVCAYESDGKRCERMIPFVSAFVDSVDLVGGRVVVDWQADY